MLCETWLACDIPLYHTGYKQFKTANDEYGGTMIIINSYKYNSMQISVPQNLKNIWFLINLRPKR